MSNKNELRQKYLAYRDSFGEDFIRGASVDACINLSKLPEFEAADTVLLYFPIRNELSPLPIFELALKSGKKAGFPVCDKKEKTIVFRAVSELEQLKAGAYGIFEPQGFCPEATLSKHTLLVVPAVALSRDGARLGYGAGFYDRFLKDFCGTSVGFGYGDLIFNSLPSEYHDEPLDIIVSEREVLYRAEKATKAF